jgi:hypothetical protein
MKRTSILFLFSLAIISCGKNKEEKMFTEFKAKELQEALKTTPEELNFKIESITKTKEIKASDSIKYLHSKLLETYKGAEEEKNIITYDYAIKQIDTLITSIQELISLNTQAGKSYENYDFKDERDNWIKKKTNLEAWKNETEEYSKNKNKILSVEYTVKYAIDNPLLKIKQNFTSQIYSNRENAKIINEIKKE